MAALQPALSCKKSPNWDFFHHVYESPAIGKSSLTSRQASLGSLRTSYIQTTTAVDLFALLSFTTVQDRHQLGPARIKLCFHPQIGHPHVTKAACECSTDDANIQGLWSPYGAEHSETDMCYPLALH